MSFSSNPLIVLICELFGITHLESMTHLGRNQVVDLHKQKLFQSQILIKDSDTFLKIHFFVRCYSHFFALTNQLPCFYILFLLFLWLLFLEDQQMFAELLTWIFFSKFNLSLSYLVFKTNPLLSILFTFATNLS